MKGNFEEPIDFVAPNPTVAKDFTSNATVSRNNNATKPFTSNATASKPSSWNPSNPSSSKKWVITKKVSL